MSFTKSFGGSTSFTGQRSQFTDQFAQVGKELSLVSPGISSVDAYYGQMSKDLNSPSSLYAAFRPQQRNDSNSLMIPKYAQQGQQYSKKQSNPSPFMGKAQELLAKYPQGLMVPTQQQQSGQNGTIGLGGGDWSQVDQWNNEVSAASAKYNVPANLIKAVMKTETGGVNPQGANGAGAMGLMQIVGEYWGGLGYDLTKPDQNIMAGAAILSQMQQSCGSWEGAISSYYTGSCTPTGAADNPAQGGSGKTDYAYVQDIVNDWHYLDGLSGGSIGNVRNQFGSTMGGTMSTGPVSYSSFVNGADAPVSQGVGPSDFASANPGMYAYGSAYGVNGHPGVDIAVPYGSTVTTPWAGTVVCIGSASYGNDQGGGGCGYYEDDNGGTGRVQIRLDNGDHIIFGHMSSSNLQPGQRVDAGTVVGRSGSAGSGAHVHVEYRQRCGSTSSGFCVVDPVNMQGTNVSGASAGGGYSPQLQPSFINQHSTVGLPSWYGKW